MDLAAIAGILSPLLALAITVTLALTGRAEARQEKRFDQQEKRFDQQEKRFDQLDADIREIRSLLMAASSTRAGAPAAIRKD